MTYPHAQRPRVIQRRALRAAAVCWALGLVVLLAWAWPGGGLLPNTRLTMAVYLTLLMVGACAGSVALVCSGQLAIHHAFAAGYETGRAAVYPNESPKLRHRSQDPVLRLVE